MMAATTLRPETSRRLFTHAEGFEDTADDVINRILDRIEGRGEQRPSAAQQRNGRAAPGEILEQREYWKPILQFLVESGGQAHANRVIDEIGVRLSDKFKPRDFEELDIGEVRWRNRVRFARLRMKERGLLDESAPRGVWRITDSGRRFLGASPR